MVVSVNCFGTVELVEALRPRLVPGAAVVAISSNSTTCQPGDAGVADRTLLRRATRPAPGRCADTIPTLNGVYPASKIAVARWVRRRATTPEWIGAGIRLNAVAPGMIETAMIAEGRADPVVGPLLDLFPIPMAARASPRKVAALIALPACRRRRRCSSVRSCSATVAPTPCCAPMPGHPRGSCDGEAHARRRGVLGRGDRRRRRRRWASWRAPPSGWLTLQPAYDADEAPPAAGARGSSPPGARSCRWPTGCRGSGPGGEIDYTAVGIQHGMSSQVVDWLASDHGLPVPTGWEVISDHPSRGLVVAVPPASDHASVLGWLLDAADRLCPIQLTGEWRASVYRRKEKP